MRSIAALLTVLACAAPAAFAQPAQPEKPNVFKQYEEQLDRSSKLMDEADSNTERQEALIVQAEDEMKLRAKQMDQAAVLFEKAEKDAIKREEQAKRFDAILDTWERQQKQYQKYLDSLPAGK